MRLRIRPPYDPAQPDPTEGMSLTVQAACILASVCFTTACLFAFLSLADALNYLVDLALS